MHGNELFWAFYVNLVVITFVAERERDFESSSAFVRDDLVRFEQISLLREGEVEDEGELFDFEIGMFGYDERVAEKT